ncbi:hypothetical protein E2C01_081842 [Portunus trituberculatus]|uniref:Uncharacterized protein n=1 Tax=Portunus trituberculatus TaxID=210409 RepID=A0A5B7J3D7_PORTR|nr:hypothetical protein [Portunus trituberculatus]
MTQEVEMEVKKSEKEKEEEEEAKETDQEDDEETTDEGEEGDEDEGEEPRHLINARRTSSKDRRRLSLKSNIILHNTLTPTNLIRADLTKFVQGP